MNVMIGGRDLRTSFFSTFGGGGGSTTGSTLLTPAPFSRFSFLKKKPCFLLTGAAGAALIREIGGRTERVRFSPSFFSSTGADAFGFGSSIKESACFRTFGAAGFAGSAAFSGAAAASAFFARGDSFSFNEEVL